MIDVHMLKSKIVQNKIEIPNEDIDVEYKPIFFFLQNDEIIYIGKTDKKISEYIFSKSKQLNCTHYFKELVNVNEIDNIMAELVLTMQPSLNSSVPKNTKYITHTKAKELFHITKNEFKKYWEENGKLKFRKTLFLEKKVFDDIFAIPEPYHKDMPKVGTFINSIEDVNNTPIDIYGLKQDYSRTKMDDGTLVEKIITYNEDISNEDNYHNLQIRLQHAYIVTNILNEHTFEAYSEYKNIKKIFIVDSKTWQKLPNEYEQEIINENYLESLKS